MATEPAILPPTLLYVGGPTAIIEFRGLRFLTDPTFDREGEVYTSATSTLTKLRGPAISRESIGPIDAVLLSHDHHADNLDRSGRSVLAHARHVLTTTAGAERLGNGAVGLSPWEKFTLASPDGGTVVVTATPARHGPADGDRGPVIGFVLQSEQEPDTTLYVSGDTVWYDGVAEVARRFPVTAAVLFMGAARVLPRGAALTMTADDGLQAASAFTRAAIVPLHFDGWKHFSESHDDIARTFASAGLGHRLRWPKPSAPLSLVPQSPNN